MQANITKTEGKKVTVELTVPVDVVKVEYKKSFDKYARNARIDGFRKGHVPKNVLLQHYSAGIQSDAVDALLNVALRDLFKQGKDLGVEFNPSELPEIAELSAFSPDAELKFTCVCTIIPKLNLEDAKAVNFEPLKVEVNDEDVKQTIETLRQQASTFEAQDDAQISDTDCEATIDFVGYRDGVAFENGAANDFKIEMGKTQMIPGFCEQLVGHKAGEQFDIECKFPEDYHVEELRGAPAKFSITVKQVALRKLPEVDAEFIKKFGYEGKSIEEFTAALKQQLNAQAQIQSFTHNLNTILAKLGEHFDVELFKPAKAEVEKNARDLAARQFLRGQKIDAKNEKFLEMLVPLCTPAVLPNLINNAFVQSLVISGDFKVEDPTDEEINAYIEQQSVLYEDPEDFKKEVREDKDSFKSIVAACSNQKFYAELCKLVTVNEKVVNYQEAAKSMQEQEQAQQQRCQELAAKWFPAADEAAKA